MTDTILADGTSTQAVTDFFEDCFTTLIENGWRCQSSYTVTEQGVRSVICATRGDERHIIVSDDVEDMMQELMRQTVGCVRHDWALV